ncbi:hypothetical protein JCM1841_000829 [Sporobolomyces salmonicolor]
MTTIPETRSLYRHFLRTLLKVSGGDTRRFVNLRRLYRPQIRQELLAISPKDSSTWKDTEAKVHRTLALLVSSPSFARNLASLAYHHTPYSLPHTSNSSRLYSHTSKPISWDPRDPSAAKKAWEKREKDRAKDPAARIAEGVGRGLRGLWSAVEREGGGVMLGRIERTRYGET